MPSVTIVPSGTQDVDVTANSIGLSTSAKQLADDHNVTVSNMIAAVETGLATSAAQTDGSQKIQVVDASGNVIDAEADDAGKYHLAVTIN